MFVADAWKCEIECESCLPCEEFHEVYNFEDKIEVSLSWPCAISAYVMNVSKKVTLFHDIGNEGSLQDVGEESKEESKSCD